MHNIARLVAYKRPVNPDQQVQKSATDTNSETVGLTELVLRKTVQL